MSAYFDGLDLAVQRGWVRRRGKNAIELLFAGFYEIQRKRNRPS